MSNLDWEKVCEQLDMPCLERGPIHWRERLFAFTPTDTAAYVRLLMEAFPTLRFFARWNLSETLSSRPAPPVTRWLGAEELATVNCATPVFDPSWKPMWERARDGSWRYAAPSSRPYGDFYHSQFHEPNKDQPRHIGEGRFNIGYTPGNKEQASIARKAMRLVGKVAVNSYQCLSWPSYEVVTRIEKGGIFWIGHDAARWVRESPDRMLWYDSGHKMGLQPLL